MNSQEERKTFLRNATVLLNHSSFPDKQERVSVVLIRLLSPGSKQQEWKDDVPPPPAHIKCDLIRSVDSALFSIKMGSFSK